MLRRTLRRAFVSALLLTTSPAMATSFVFTGGNSATSGSTGNSGAYTAGGLTLTATGWSTDSLAASALPEAAYLGAYSAGLGVTNTNEGNGGSLNSHTIDNVGSYDFIRLVFAEPVSLTGIVLNPFSVNGGLSIDKDAWVSFGHGAFNTVSTWQGFLDRGVTVNNGVGFSSNNVGTEWLIGAARSASDRDDGFKLAGITAIAAVPEPATWAMMLVGFGGIGFAMRRSSKARTTASYA